jgi:hypothetical protein
MQHGCEELWHFGKEFYATGMQPLMQRWKKCMLIYNRLPNEIKSVKSMVKLKKILSELLLEKSFCSEKEFMTVDS